jgi:uncharacterized protein HemY
LEPKDEIELVALVIEAVLFLVLALALSLVVARPLEKGKENGNWKERREKGKR